MRNPCHICKYPILYDAPPLHPQGYVLDEEVPIKLGGRPNDPSNCKAAHRYCNGLKGAKPPSPQLYASIRRRYEMKFLGRSASGSEKSKRDGATYKTSRIW